jgi:hypothetical protein
MLTKGVAVTDSELMARVLRLEDERQITDVLHLCSQLLDEGTPAANADWVDLFTDDGVFAYKPRADAEWLFRLEGREELERFTSRTGFPEGIHENHLLVNSRVVSVDGDRASAYSYYVILKGSTDDVWVNTSGRYHDTLERGADGRWRLKERLAVGDFMRQVTSPVAQARWAGAEPGADVERPEYMSED